MDTVGATARASRPGGTSRGVAAEAFAQKIFGGYAGTTRSPPPTDGGLAFGMTLERDAAQRFVTVVRVRRVRLRDRVQSAVGPLAQRLLKLMRLMHNSSLTVDVGTICPPGHMQKL